MEKNKILSEALQTLATEHHELEQSVVKGSSGRSALSEDEFYDALSGETHMRGKGCRHVEHRGSFQLCKSTL